MNVVGWKIAVMIDGTRCIKRVGVIFRVQLEKEHSGWQCRAVICAIGVSRLKDIGRANELRLSVISQLSFILSLWFNHLATVTIHNNFHTQICNQIFEPENKKLRKIQFVIKKIKKEKRESNENLLKYNYKLERRLEILFPLDRRLFWSELGV